MLTFWIIAVLFILIALAFVVPPLLKTALPVTDNQDRNRLNVAIYKERLAELEQEYLTPEQREVAKQELDKTLLQELEDNPQPRAQPRAKWASVLVSLGLPMIAVGSYLYLGSPQLLSPPPVTQDPVATNPQVPPDFKKMVDNLAARLEKQPNDEKGWQMLARSYVFLEDYKLAMQTYNKLLAKFGDNPETLTDLAEFVAKSNDDELAGLPSLLLKAALNLNPNYQDALWLAGFAAAQRNDFQGAIDHWQRFLTQLPDSEVEIRQSLEKHIAEARRQMTEGSPASSTAAATSSTATENVAEATTASSAPQGNVTSATQGNATAPETNAAKDVNKDVNIEVSVNLDPALQEKVNPENTLFIYARPTQGPPMPLAIVKKTAKELPTKVVLNDSLALTPTMKLSNFPEVIILARISSSGQATPQQGDLLGQSDTVVVGKQGQVAVTINQVVP